MGYIHLYTKSVSHRMHVFDYLFQRITIKEIKSHPWFLKNLPKELTDTAQASYYRRDVAPSSISLQTIDDIMKIVGEARNPPPASRSIGGLVWGGEEDEENKENAEDEEDLEEEEDEEDEYEKSVRQVHASGEFHIT